MYFNLQCLCLAVDKGDNSEVVLFCFLKFKLLAIWNKGTIFCLYHKSDFEKNYSFVYITVCKSNFTEIYLETTTNTADFENLDPR